MYYYITSHHKCEQKGGERLFLDKRKTELTWLNRLTHVLIPEKKMFTVRESEERGFSIIYVPNRGFHFGPMMDWEPITFLQLIAMLNEHEIEVKTFIKGMLQKVPEESKKIFEKPTSTEETALIDDIIQQSIKETMNSWIILIEKRLESEGYPLASRYLEERLLPLLTLGDKPELLIKIVEIIKKEVQ